MGIFKIEFHNKVYYYLLPVLAFVLPIHERIVALVIALIGLNWLLEFNFGEKYRRLKGSRISRLTLLFGIIYLPYVAGVFYSENFSGWSGAYFALEEKLSLLVFPLLISTIRPETIAPGIYLRILKGFIWGCLFSAFFILNLAVFHYFKEDNTAVFFYSRLSDPFHPSYLALYYSFAIAILSYWLIRFYQVNMTKTVAVIILLVFFQMLIILLSSKAGIIGVFLVYGVLLFFSLLKIAKEGPIPVWILLALITSFFMILILTPPAYNRFVTAGGSVENTTGENLSANTNESTAARIIAWRNSWEVIKENPLWGVGPGDVKHELMEKYRENGYQLAYEKGLNSHNQFLQTYMATGFPGFALLVLSFLIPGWFAFRKRKVIYFTFILLMVFHNLVEGMLDRQAGVVFYGFFNALLFYFAVLRPNDQAP